MVSDKRRVPGVTADSELTINAYTAEPGSKSEEALHLLASWTATLEPEAHASDLIGH